MTVIAYKDGIMAADSLYVWGGMQRMKSWPKILETEYAVWGGAGSADSRAIDGLLLKATDVTTLPTNEQLVATNFEGQVLLCFRKKKELWVIYCSIEKPQNNSCVHLKDKYFAIGSGGDYALGLMAGGLSAEEAVRITCTISVQCGPPVQVVEV